MREGADIGNVDDMGEMSFLIESRREISREFGRPIKEMRN
jgi:hypothetical protein